MKWNKGVRLAGAVITQGRLQTTGELVVAYFKVLFMQTVTSSICKDRVLLIIIALVEKELNLQV
jgi:hypothetical protein